MDPLFNNWLRSRGVPVSVPVDPIGTSSYEKIQKQAAQVLQRNIPPNLQGAGFQNVNTNIIGELNRIENMPLGAEKEAARNRVQQYLQRQSSLQKGPTSFTGSQGPTGELRAPGSTRPRINYSVRPQSPFPGTPYATDYGLTRQSPIPQMSSDIRRANTPRPSAGRAPVNFSPWGQGASTAPPIGRPRATGTERIVGNAPLRQATSGAKGLKGVKVGPLSAVVNAGLIANDVYNASQTGGDPLRTGLRGVVGIAGGTLGAAGAGLLGLPTGPGAGAAAIGGYLAGNTVSEELFDAFYPRQRKETTKPGGYLDLQIDPTTNKPTLVTKAGPPISSAGSRQGTGAWTINGWDPNAKPYTPEVDEIIVPTYNPPVADGSTVPTANPQNTDLPPSSEQVAPVDPYAYSLSIYGQGRQAADSQEAMNKVRDLGLAINQAKYSQFYRESYNPLMAATFPERYQKTPENFVVQQGIQVPVAMTAKDSQAELFAAEEDANVKRLDQSSQRVEEFLKDYLSKGAI